MIPDTSVPKASTLEAVTELGLLKSLIDPTIVESTMITYLSMYNLL